MSEQHSHIEQKCNSPESPDEKEESHIKFKSNLRSRKPDIEPKEIKNIYVDCKFLLRNLFLFYFCQ